MRRAAAWVSLLLATAACGLGAGQPSPDQLPGVAFLRAVPAEDHTALLDELRRAGFDDGRNIRLINQDPASTHPTAEQAADAVRGWLEEGLDLVLAFSSRGALAVQQEAPDTQVVFVVNHPSAVGLVRDEQRPEGSSTGVTFRVPADRTLDYAVQALGGIRRVGFVASREDPAGLPHAQAVAAAAEALGMHMQVEMFEGPADVGGAVDVLVEAGAEVLVVGNSPGTIQVQDAIASANAGRVPMVANTSVVTGALVVLEPDVPELTRQMARQAARLLSGVPVELIPVEDPRRYRLILREGEAQAQGITLPEGLIRQAWRVDS